MALSWGMPRVGSRARGGFAFVAGLGLLATGGCGASPPSASSNAVRDSAGVRIVESLSDTRYPVEWTLDPTPMWSVGLIDGDPKYLLSRVVGARQLPDGSILIANGGTSELRFYDANGTFVGARGREGEGPGEFEYLRGLGVCREDGFIAFDLNWQMNAYQWDGTFIEKTTVLAPDGITPYNLACDPHGHVLLLGWGRDASAAPVVGFYEARDRLVLSDGAGGVETDFGEWLVSERLGSLGGSRPHPAGRATRFALSADRLFVGSGERFEVEVRDLANTLVALLRGPGVDLAVTDSVRAAYLDSRLATTPEERHADVRRTVQEWAWPSAVPAFDDIRVDAEGLLWLRKHTVSSGEPEVWSIMDQERGYQGDLVLPPSHTLLEAGARHLLLLATDELGVERVVRLSLTRRATTIA